MYVLTIVMLVSRATLFSSYVSMEACEQSATRVRAFEVGPQAVESARCNAVLVASASAK